jgi:hypothetical protein
VKRERLTEIVLVAVQSGPNLFSVYGSAAFHLAFGGEERDRTVAAWWNISHGVVMAIQTVEARIHGVPRNFTDVIVFLVIGVVLLALLPAKREAVTPGVA